MLAVRDNEVGPGKLGSLQYVHGGDAHRVALISRCLSLPLLCFQSAGQRSTRDRILIEGRFQELVGPFEAHSHLLHVTACISRVVKIDIVLEASSARLH